jgi:hypothetical protein
MAPDDTWLTDSRESQRRLEGNLRALKRNALLEELDWLGQTKLCMWYSRGGESIKVRRMYVLSWNNSVVYI